MYKKINNWWICRPVLKLHVALFFYEEFRTSPHLLKITETLRLARLWLVKLKKEKYIFILNI